MSIAPYGTWSSPITAASIAEGSTGLGAVASSGGSLWWSEQRSSEGGRTVVVRDGTDVLGEGWNARTQVHEYGGGAWTVRGETLFFSNWSDQRIYRQEMGIDPVPITPEPEIPRGLRYADGVVTEDGLWMVCVRERHVEGREAFNEIVVLPTSGEGEPQILVGGNDFYSTPRLSPDESKLAWLEWSHPNMPWDGTWLYVADFSPEGVSNVELVAGGRDESVFQPEWSPAGDLHYVSDGGGWWNIYGPRGCVLEMEAEFGVPLWVFGVQTYTFLPDGSIVTYYAPDGVWQLAVIDNSGGLRSLGVSRDRGSYLAVHEGRVATVDASPTDHPALVLVDPSSGQKEVVRRARETEVDERYTSVAEAISFLSGDRTAHGLFYRPRNDDFDAPDGERPPLLVFTHGGPTAQAHASYNASIQFWTSRGFAVVDVNYGGSTGYGTEYRRLLNENWGVVDLEDCVAAAEHLVGRGDVDGDRLAIRGGSAGGYTTLCALTFTDVFKAGANHFGVAELETFVGDTHKFESRYLDTLVGPYPERKDLYFERSPTNFVDRVSCPLITFQGMEDEIVPPSQSELIVEALRKKGIPCAYVTYEGEQHGFRKSENIIHSLESELYFYGKVFGFEPADDLQPVEIENLD
jgi:dipeptidyl aminopeptidase/acylaminoacyl peptidase